LTKINAPIEERREWRKVADHIVAKIASRLEQSQSDRPADPALFQVWMIIISDLQIAPMRGDS
jgi:hypothetical protein